MNHASFHFLLTKTPKENHFDTLHLIKELHATRLYIINKMCINIDSHILFNCMSCQSHNEKYAHSKSKCTAKDDDLPAQAPPPVLLI